MIKVVADTNIWYEIAGNIRDINTLNKKNIKICITPLSVLEILKGICESDFELRKNVAQTAYKYADEVLDEAPWHLAKIWGFPIRGYKRNWKEDYLKPILNIPDYSSMVKGYPDYILGSTKRINLESLRETHIKLWVGWEDMMITIIESICPGYRQARQEGKIKYLRKMELEDVKAFMQKEKFKNQLVRGLLYWTEPARKPRFVVDEKYIKQNINKVKKRLSPYINAYIEYNLKCMNEFAPEVNDYTDMLQFLYLQDNTRLLTSEIKWNDIARKTCPEYLFDLKSD